MTKSFTSDAGEVKKLTVCECGQSGGLVPVHGSLVSVLKSFSMAVYGQKSPEVARVSCLISSWSLLTRLRTLTIVPNSTDLDGDGQ